MEKGKIGFKLRNYACKKNNWEVNLNFVIVGLIKGILYRYSTKNPSRD